MSFEIVETRYDTWVVVNRDDGTIQGEFENEWEAYDLRDSLELMDSEWNEIDGDEEDVYDWEE